MISLSSSAVTSLGVARAISSSKRSIATEAARKVKVEYKPLEHQVVDSNPELFRGTPGKKEQGHVDEAFGAADLVTHTGTYGVPVITH